MNINGKNVTDRPVNVTLPGSDGWPLHRLFNAGLAAGSLEECGKFEVTYESQAEERWGKMVSVKEAKVVTGTYTPFGGGRCEIFEPLFDIDEVERAEAIMKILRGLSIAEAQELLEKINQYLLMAKIK